MPIVYKSMAPSAGTVPQPPSAPRTLTVTGVSQSTVSLSWLTPTTGPVLTYNVYRNGSKIAQGLTGLTYTDTGLTAATVYQYTVTAQNLIGEGPASNIATGTTSGATGRVKKFNPSIAYWQIDYNESLQSQYDSMATIKSRAPHTKGFEFAWPWALLENPALVGGAAQYDGSWNFANDQTQINNLRGFALVDKFTAQATALGCQIMWSIRCLGGHSAGGDQNPTHFPSSFVPLYFQGSAYGGNTASTNGRWGAVWINSYGGPNDGSGSQPGNGSAFTMYVRWWDALVTPLYAAFANAYGQRYNSNPNLEMVSWGSDEVISAVTTGQTEANHYAQVWGPGGIMSAWNSAFPNTIVRCFESYRDLPHMDLINSDSVSTSCAIGGPDTANDQIYTGQSSAVLNSNGQYRSVTAIYRWKGFSAAPADGGTRDTSVPVYSGIGCYVCEVEGEDLAYDSFSNTTYSGDGRHIGDGVLQHIVAQGNMLGAQYWCWYYSTQDFGRPSHLPLSSTVTPEGSIPNILDYVEALAIGGNTSVNGVIPGIAQTNFTYPTGWSG